MFCLEIPNLPFGWQPCYFRPLPCFIHISSVQAAKLKSSRPDVFDPSDVLMRSLTLRSMFSTSVSTVSFSPDDWAPSVSTTLGYNPLASGVYPFEPSSLVWLWKRQAAAVIMCVWMALSVSHSARWAALCCLFSGWAALVCLIVAAVELNLLLLPGLRDSLPHSKKKKKKTEWRRRIENQFLIKQICKGCIKRCSTFALDQMSVWCDLENLMHRLTNVHACLLRRKVLLLSSSWLILGSSLLSLSNMEKMAQWCTNQKENQ